MYSNNNNNNTNTEMFGVKVSCKSAPETDIGIFVYEPFHLSSCTCMHSYVTCLYYIHFKIALVFFPPKVDSEAKI